MNKKRLLTYGRLLLSALLIGILIFNVDRQTFVPLFAQMRMDTYFLGLALFFAAIGISAYRWQTILAAAGYAVGIQQLAAINLIGNFFSNFLPTAVGGDVIRIAELAQQGQAAPHHIISTVMLDRLIGLISLALMAAIALMAGFSTVNSLMICAMLFGAILILLAGWGLFFHKPFVQRFRWIIQLPLLCRMERLAVRLYRSLYALQDQKRLLAISVAISLLLQVVEVVAVICIARSLAIETSMLYFFLFLPLIWLVTMMPLSLNGLGLRESAFTFFFGLVGVAAPQAIALSLLVYSCRLFSGMVGGALYARATLVRQIQPIGQVD